MNIDSLVKEINKAIGAEQDFGTIYRKTIEFCDDFDICGIRELNTAVLELTDLLDKADSSLLTTKGCIRITLYNEAIIQFTNTTPLKSGIITEAIRLIERVDRLFSESIIVMNHHIYNHERK